MSALSFDDNVLNLAGLVFDLTGSFDYSYIFSGMDTG